MTDCLQNHCHLRAQGFPGCEYIGIQSDFDGGWLELFNCPRCHSTLSRRVRRKPVMEVRA